MNHFYVSIIKSAVRIITGIVAFITKSIKLLAAGIVLAEVLGILEELFDINKSKEE